MSRASNPTTGMLCMHPCKTRLKITDVTQSDDGATVLRHRLCPACGRRYSTEERRVLATPGARVSFKR